MKLKTTLTAVSALAFAASSQATEIIHDAEQTILQEQYGEQWAAQDKEIAKKLAALEAKHGKKTEYHPHHVG